jgi:hypothetical protein
MFVAPFFVDYNYIAGYDNVKSSTLAKRNGKSEAADDVCYLFRLVLVGDSRRCGVVLVFSESNVIASDLRLRAGMVGDLLMVGILGESARNEGAGVATSETELISSRNAVEST